MRADGVIRGALQRQRRCMLACLSLRGDLDRLAQPALPVGRAATVAAYKMWLRDDFTQGIEAIPDVFLLPFAQAFLSGHAVPRFHAVSHQLHLSRHGHYPQAPPHGIRMSSKKRSWFWPSLVWLFFCMILYWVAGVFRGAAAKAGESKERPKKKKKDEDDLSF
jgi:hypothetical protein